MSRRHLARAAALAALVVSSAFVMPSTPASAFGRPQRDSFSFPISDVNPAGEICDFTLKGEGTITVTVQTFVNRAGDVVSDMTHVVAVFTHSNLDTGAYLTERLVENGKNDFVDGTGSTVGIQWHLKDPSGHGVLTVSGRLTYTLDPFEILRVTPRVEAYLDFPEVICPALGGSSA
jgi:hypothetical protein